ncbi:hypothetical protein CSKR_100203 [Clonorchis sinensis]|uniref:Uncharacterized protein n=1 Tax=Clonorchis sinensis TaxID=79923 RepID=A0A3R7FD00_CLOSI|nr:hypothetical protein CSKR_100203 [Clonorchis sinensis]
MDEMVQWFECEFTDRKVRGSNPTSASRLPLSGLGQPGCIQALMLPTDSMAVRHRKGVTAEYLLEPGDLLCLAFDFKQIPKRQNTVLCDGNLEQQFKNNTKRHSYFISHCILCLTDGQNLIRISGEHFQIGFRRLHSNEWLNNISFFRCSQVATPWITNCVPEAMLSTK